MTTPSKRRSRRSVSLVLGLTASLALAAQDGPTLAAYWDFDNTANPTRTLDKVYGFEGVLEAGAAFAPGRTGGAGDNAIDFGFSSASQLVRVTPAPFLNLAAARDQITISFWQSLHGVAASSAFWGVSPSSSNGERGIQAHAPWSNNNIYFDTAGCCDGGTQRINADVVAFEPNFAFGWHHLAFVKDGSTKQIWVNGQLFLEGINTLPLPQDFTSLVLGAEPPGGNSMQGVLDDFAVFVGALSPASIALLAGGTPPDQLPGVPVMTDPLVGAVAGTHIGFSVGITDSPALPVDPDSIAAQLDGSPVTVSVSKVGNLTTVAYSDPETLLPPASTHEVILDFKDTAGNDYSAVRSFTVVNYSILPAAFALAPGSATTPGIRFKSHWAADHTGSTLPTTIARAEAQIAGTLLAEWGEPYINWATAGPNADGSYTVPVVNFEQEGNDAGQIPGDTTFPGLDWPDDYNNLATEALAYLDLKAGYHRFGVNSDDGFQLRVGHPARSVLDSQVLGAFDAGRGAADSVFDFLAPVDGIYPFRLLYFEGGGGASLEWWSVDLDTGGRILINDTANPKAIRSFAFATAVDSLPFVRGVSPLPDQEHVELDSRITATLVDGASALPAGSIRMQLNGTSVTPAVTAQGGVTTVTYTPVPGLEVGTLYTVTLTFGTGAQEVSNEWQFTTKLFYPNTLVAYWPFNDASNPDTTLDVVAQIPGSLEAGAAFTPDGGGFTGLPGDRAIDFGVDSAQQLVRVLDASIFTRASQRDQITLSFWQSLHNISSSSSFWAVSPSSSDGQRGIQAHVPWGDNNIYFDTAGCCGADTQRIAANVLAFEPDFGTGWHHLAFVKHGPNKQIWINGRLFHEGLNTFPLPSDFVRLMIGANSEGGNGLQGILDDFAIFANALSPEDIALLAAGTSPTDIAEDSGEVGTFTAIGLADGQVVIQWDGSGTLESAPTLNGPWTPEPAATSPHQIAPTGTMKYFRLRQ